MSFAEFPLKDLFSIGRGSSKFTRKYGSLNKGEYPVFSGATEKPLAYINKFDYHGEFLSWSANGLGGFIKILDGKFSINGDRGILIPKKEGIDLEYARYILQPIFRGLAKGRRLKGGKNEYTKVHPYMIEDVLFKLPVLPDGTFDLEMQKHIASKFKFLETKRLVLKNLKQHLKNLSIGYVSPESGFLDYPLSSIGELFEIKKGNSLYTKDYIKANSGEFPLYSSQTKNDGIIGLIDSYDYDVPECLTWTSDGVYAGTVFLRTEKFSMTTHCGALVPKVGNLHLPYFLHVLNQTLPIFAEGIKGQNKRVTKNIVENVNVPVPVKANGEYDIEKQIQLTATFSDLASKMEVVETIKENVVARLDETLSLEVQI